MNNDMMICPNCQSRQVGSIAPKRRFCRNCYVEFKTDADIASPAEQVYLIDIEGNLLTEEDIKST